MKNYFYQRSQSTSIDGVKSGMNKILLGVPQGSVLGPILFIILINDLVYHIKRGNSKLFADDTTVYTADVCLDMVFSRMKLQIEEIIQWCQLNRLEINWSKTQLMLVHHVRFKGDPPDKLVLDSLKIEISIVNSFKLLGVELDSLLNFNKHVTKLCLSVNKKLYSIKRLFHLTFDVKFFQSFILPHFDYCLSLVIYMPKTALQRISNCYYVCLSKLFNFNFVNLELYQINSFLKAYNLLPFQYRLYYKLAMFGFCVNNGVNSPQILKFYLVERSELISNNLRSSNKFNIIASNFKAGDLTFQFFYPRLLNCNLFLN